MACGLAVTFGIDKGIVSSVCGAVMSVASLITYIVTEGRIDATAAADAADKIQSAFDEISGEDGD